MNDLQALRRESPDSFYVLDQLKLPSQIQEIKIVTIQDAWNSIKNMNVRGAPLISVVATQGLRNFIFQQNFKTIEELKDQLKKQIQYIRTSRTTAVNLQNDTQRLLDYIEEKNQENYNIGLENFKQILFKMIDQFKDQYINACDQIAKHGYNKIIDFFQKKAQGQTLKKLRVLTICNTGKLATPGCGTALGIVREINKNNMLDTLYITETRPYNQGSRLTATEAILDRIPSVLITDNMVGALMLQNKVDLVITGADRVALNGDTANKIGTYQLAVLANYHKIPFYVALPLQTIDKNTLNHKQIEIEERPKKELTHLGELQIAPNDINVWNPSFDVTPSNLITKIFHEEGEYEFDREIGAWQILTNENIFGYLVNEVKLFEQSDNLKILDVGDGNLNLVFAVKNQQEKSVIVKQALPYVKCVGPQWPFSLKRSFYEAKALQFEQKYAEDFVPKFLLYDEQRCSIIMEYLAPPYIILRQGLLNFTKYERMSVDVGHFIAQTTFFSSALHLNNKKYREYVSFWNGNNQMCELTEQVIFSDPYVEAQYNKWTSPQLNEIVDQFKNKDDELILAISELRNKFITLKQALIHGDLHTGSIMVTEQQTKVIDPEFSFYGPIGFDLGAFIANLFLNYFSLKQYGSSEFHKKYAEWIIEQIIVFYNSFENKFIELWNNQNNIKDSGDYTNILIGKNQNLKEKAQKKYLQQVFYDTVGFTAAKIIRRIIGVAHVQDLESIKDPQLKSFCEKSALNFARDIMVNRYQFNNITEVVNLSKNYYKN